MTNVFDYTNYRTYLHDCYREKKEQNPGFSYTVFSARAGFRNKGFLHNVIHGSKNLSKQSVLKISRGLKHTKSEAEYFENLVFFNQAADREERAHYYEAMVSVKSRDPSAVETLELRKDQYEYYSQWYHSAVRSIIGLIRFAGDYQWLARTIDPPILPKEAKKSVALLVKLGLVRRGEDGVYELARDHITTGSEILDVAALNFHRRTTELAARAIDRRHKDERNITGLTIGTSPEAYAKICEAAREFRKKVVKIVDTDPHRADRVYQLNMHLFPFSRRVEDT